MILFKDPAIFESMSLGFFLSFVCMFVLYFYIILIHLKWVYGTVEVDNQMYFNSILIILFL